MLKVTVGRVFALGDRSPVLCLSFTSDNRFLLSSHQSGLICIWNIMDNQLYKEYQLPEGRSLIWHTFTPDNQFLLSAHNNSTQADVWNNYIGKISTSRDREAIAFHP
jgi:WD40 repeat protein